MAAKRRTASERMRMARVYERVEGNVFGAGPHRRVSGNKKVARGCERFCEPPLESSVPEICAASAALEHRYHFSSAADAAQFLTPIRVPEVSLRSTSGYLLPSR